MIIAKKIDRYIEIARSSTLELSSLSLESCEAIYEVLAAKYTAVGVSTVNNIADLEQLVAKQPDLVFMGMKQLAGDASIGLQNTWISKYLEDHGITHTGSSHEAIKYEFNKPLAKQRALVAGLQTSAFVVVKNGSEFDAAKLQLKYPLFVKPSNLGGGQGIDDNSRVSGATELQAKVESLMSDFSSDVLIEEYLPGREFSVAVLKEEYSDKLLAMPIELVARINGVGERILSEAVKTQNQESVYPVDDPAVRAKIVSLALGVFRAIGARDYGRIDVRLDHKGTANFLEANLIPSLISGYGSFPKACLTNLGIGFEEMILRIVRLGLERVPAIPELVDNNYLISWPSSVELSLKLAISRLNDSLQPVV